MCHLEVGAGRGGGSRRAVSALGVSRAVLGGMVHHARSRHELAGVGVRPIINIITVIIIITVFGQSQGRRRQKQFSCSSWRHVQHRIRASKVAVGAWLEHTATVDDRRRLGALRLDALVRSAGGTTRGVHGKATQGGRIESSPQQQQ